MIQYEDLLGKPFEEYANGPDSFNCYGLVRELHRRRGVELPDLNAVYSALGPQPERGRLAAIILQEAECGWDVVEEPEDGAVVVLRVLRRPSHLGYMIDRYRFAHVLEDDSMPGGSNVVVVQRLDSHQWSHKIEEFRVWRKTSA